MGDFFKWLGDNAKIAARDVYKGWIERTWRDLNSTPAGGWMGNPFPTAPTVTAGLNFQTVLLVAAALLVVVIVVRAD